MQSTVPPPTAAPPSQPGAPSAPEGVGSPAVHHITIFINDERYTAPATRMTGAELKRLGDVPAGNRLYREEPGSHPDAPVGDDQVVELKSGDKFYDLPPGVVGISMGPRALRTLPSVAAQLDRLREEYPLVDVRPQPDGTTHVVVGPVRLAAGWKTRRSRVLFVLPVGYPQARPSGFSAEPDILLENGAPAAGTGRQHVGGEDWLSFCWQPASWDHDRETLWRYVKFCEQRFAELR